MMIIYPYIHSYKPSTLLQLLTGVPEGLKTLPWLCMSCFFKTISPCSLIMFWSIMLSRVNNAFLISGAAGSGKTRE